MQRAVKVEASFDGSTWVDISSKVKMAAGISVNRGRESEVDDPVAVGTVSLALDNSDGRFSPELASSPYYPNVVAGVPLRVSVYVSGAWRVRGYGKVQEWSTDPLSWYVAECSLNAADALGSLPEYTLHQASDEVMLSREHPYHYWPLRDSEGPAKSIVGGVDLTDNAGSGWGAGGLLPMDEGDQQHPQFTSGSGGLTLRTQALNVAPPYRIVLVMMDDPGANCTVLSGLPGGRSIRYAVGDGYDLYPENIGGVVPATYPCVVFLTVRAATYNVGVLEYDGFGDEQAPQTLTVGTLRGLTVNPTLSGGAVWGAGHLAVTPATASGADWWLDHDTAKLLLGSRVPVSTILPTDVVSQLLAYANAGLTMTGLDYGSVVMPQTEGRDLADAVGAIAKSMGGRIVDDLDGTLTWVPFPPTGTVVTLPAGFAVPPYGTDDRAWLSDCTVEYPDGARYTATRADGPRRSDSIEAVHLTRNGDQGMADWLVNSPTKARIPSIVYNLSAMTDADVLTVLNLVVGSRVSFPTLPAWIPSGLICTVEGFQESMDNDAWTLTINLSPDAYSRTFVLDDATRGVLDSAYLLAP